MNLNKSTELDEKYFKKTKQKFGNNIVTMNSELIIYAKAEQKLVIFDFTTHQEILLSSFLNIDSKVTVENIAISSSFK